MLQLWKGVIMFREKPLTIEDFQTRESAEKVLLQILEPLKLFYSKEKARVLIGETSAHYEMIRFPWRRLQDRCGD